MNNRNRVSLTVFSVFLGATLASIGNYACSPAPSKAPTTKTITSDQPPATSPSNGAKTKEVLKLTPPADRVVRVDGEIGENANGIVNEILRLGMSDEPIYVELNSPGGSVLDGAMIISAMEAAKGPVITICNMLCASMAAMIFEHGTSRYMVDRSFVMFHPASGGAQGELDKMVSRLGSVQHFMAKLEAHVAARAGISFEKYKQLSGVELWIDSEDAVNSNFADKIVSVILPAPAPQMQLFQPGNYHTPNKNATLILDPSTTFVFPVKWSL